MECREHHHEARAVMMNPVNQPSTRRRRDDESHAVVRVIRRRHVVQHQERAGHGLHDGKRDQDCAGSREPPGAGPRAHNLTMTSPLSRMSAASVSSGRGGGPEATRPSASYTPPWHGHRNVFVAPSQPTWQPRCVHVPDSARTDFSPSHTRKTVRLAWSRYHPSTSGTTIRRATGTPAFQSE